MPKRSAIVVEDLMEQLFALLYQRDPVPEGDVIQRVVGRGKASKAHYRLYSQLRHEGWLVRNSEGQITVLTRTGTLRVHPRGFGFVVNPDYQGDDVFVPERWLLSATHDDQVLVWMRRVPGSPGPEGRIMNILTRATQEVVGRLDRARNGSWRVIPEDPRRPLVWLGRPSTHGLKAGAVALARITEWPLDPKLPVRGEIQEILGEFGSPGVDVRAVMVAHHLPARFPPEVLAEAERLPESVRDIDWHGRRDLTRYPIVTIDGQDAKDLDDAISVERIDQGYRVGVHIADVSYYVPEDSALDREARQRGTSVYLVDRVIPMLPERLSNGIASLNPMVPRLAVTAWVTLDRTGKPIQTAFERTVIQSRRRLTYEGVNRWFQEGQADDAEIGDLLQTAREVHDLLRKRRMERGAVDFDLPETKVILDAAGHPIAIQPRVRDIAESIIEEFMLLANEAVARELLQHQLPGLFRVHDEPGADKLDQFRELIGALGYRLPKRVTPKALQQLLNQIKGRPEERVISSALLRSMKQARYGPENTGHFGLASGEYTHFTSPIRRYPDLWVHRILTKHLEGPIAETDLTRWKLLVSEVGEIASAREREAMDAERDSVALKEAEFMAQHIGEVYDAVISGVAAFGIFVELPNLIEGLVRIEDLPRDYWVHDPIHYQLRGERTGRVFQLGQEIRVRVARVDIGLRRIDFVLDQAATAKPEKSRARRR
ncbi:ribonuclease R [Sulfobacillus acidophilus TPY]|nr:ribonuclease R [Sulfobacillus acidophilus TPY]